MASYYILNVPKLANERAYSLKQPFPHQQEAFAKLSKTLKLPIKGYKGTLLVLPTGGGKTFTSINWICRNILNSGSKVLWLAQSAYLLDQAAETFRNEIHNANGRDKVNLRVVSSSKEHSNQGSIELTDDILICTTQTAISAYSSELLDGKGNVVRPPFRKFIDSSKESQLFVVIDEAHHTPAYGCRTLLLSLREEIPNLYILGLTATPMHMDKRISGWLKKIFDKWICYEASKEKLELNKILAVPKYIERQTGMEFEVDDELFERLMNKHKDLPEAIIEALADNQGRNNLIVDDYHKNQSEYGKTLIFADRWFQCEYIVEKLHKLGYKAAAVYSLVAKQDAEYQSGSGRRNDKKNRQVMQDFREGKYDVVVNVKMLTEGVDVPDVKTVMITRQTTSNIMLTQMIGRALRGEKAGGGKDKDYANIVFFHDTWKRLLPWANVDGDTLAERPPTQRRNPMELVSILLVKLAAQDIHFKGFAEASYLTFIPVGFLVCEYTVAADDSEEMLTFAENVIVYEFNKDKYLALLDYLGRQNLVPYSAEDISADQLYNYASELSQRFFDIDKDGFDGMLVDNIVKIVCQMAQNNIEPEYIEFAERSQYDLDQIAEGLLNTPPLDADIILRNRFNDARLHWTFLYKTFDSFMLAYYKSQRRVLNKRYNITLPVEILPEAANDDTLSENLKRQVLARDINTCLCCGKNSRQGGIMTIDHILPVSMGGKNWSSNLQTLCKVCNTFKGVNEINFRKHSTPLSMPKAKLRLHESIASDYLPHSVARVVNEFYHCASMAQLNFISEGDQKFHTTWEIVLHKGNNPDWLLKHKQELIAHLQLVYPYVEDIIVRN